MSASGETRQSQVGYLQLILRRFADDEALCAKILDGVGVSAADADEENLELLPTQILRLFDNMRGLFGDGWVVDMPELWRPAAHGALSLACLSAPTIGASLAILAKYTPSRFAIPRFSATHKPGFLVVRLTTSTPLTEAQQRMFAEASLLGVSFGMDALIGAPKAEVRFEFRWPRPDHAERLEAAFGAEVRWNARYTAIMVPQRLLEMRASLADPVLHLAALQRLENRRRSERAPEGVRGSIERLLAHSDTGRVPGAAAAHSLGLSRRTLMRRLANAGPNYRDLVDAELRTRAQRWLEAGELSRAEIGERLGFADSSGFSRACRRWFRSEA